MKSEKPGTDISGAEVSNISRHGFWIFLGNRELFVSFQDFPWFEHASVSQILRVERPEGDHLYWPELDIDLSVDSIEHPDRFPLVSTPRA